MERDADGDPNLPVREDANQAGVPSNPQVLRETPDAQALLMPGGLWYAIHAVPLLEAEYGRPVLLNILSTTRAALHAAGKRMHERPDARWGKVLASV